MEQNSTETKSAAERMWGEMLPFVQAMLEEEDAEIRELLTLIVIPAGWPCAIDALRKLKAWCKANNREAAPGVVLREGFGATGTGMPKGTKRGRRSLEKIAVA